MSLSAQDNIISIESYPDGNCNLLQYSVIRIEVRVRQRQIMRSGSFKVILRTNINQNRRIFRQIIDKVEKQQSYSTDFYDIPMKYNAVDDLYFADILLSESGYFQFKARVESTDKHLLWSKWAGGPNVGVSVTPLDYGRDNSIYCAFIRQYGDNKDQASLRDEEMERAIDKLEEKGAYVLPPGGNFEKFKEELPFIVDKLGMKIIHLLPINPVPTSYGRMGMYGSPYATTDYFGIDHTYGTFNRYKTIEDQFIDLTSTIHGLGARAFLDMVINHTGWASSLLFTHRNWFKTRKDQKLVSPGAWGVVWGDLVELDYQYKDMWKYMADVFLAWCERGIDGFRLDAGYMIPIEVWQYIIAKVRKRFPDTMFLLEGLGGPWDTTEKLLTEGLQDWAYSELFQNYSKEQINNYMKYALDISKRKGALVNYAETHDNDRLAKKGKVYARMRLWVNAFLSSTGAWGFTNGVEWLATEQINVHRNTGLNWGAQENLVEDIARINEILRQNPSFWHGSNIRMLDTNNDNIIMFLRIDSTKSNVILGAINLDVENSHEIYCELGKLNIPDFDEGKYLHELLANSCEIAENRGLLKKQLAPGQCMLFRLEPKHDAIFPEIPAIFIADPAHIALTYRILLSRFEPWEVAQINQQELLKKGKDYRRFIALVNNLSLNQLIKCDIEVEMERITDEQIDRYSAVWSFQESTKEYIIPGDKWLMVDTFVPGTAYLKVDDEELCYDSIPSPDGLGHETYFEPIPDNVHAKLRFSWKIRQQLMTQRQNQPQEYPIMSLAWGARGSRKTRVYPIKLSKQDLGQDYGTVVLTNGLGSLCQMPAIPGQFNTKYDSMLAIPKQPDNLCDRTSLLRGFVETIQVGSRVFDLDNSFLESFIRYPHPTWVFNYDDGHYNVKLERTVVMPDGKNVVYIRYKIKEANTQVKLLSKCYLDYRSVHSQTRVRQDSWLENMVQHSCHKLERQSGFLYSPNQEYTVLVSANKGEFLDQPSWVYDIYCRQDQENGLDSVGDSFSPGLFDFELNYGESATILVAADPRQQDDTVYKAEMFENKRVKELLSKVRPTESQRDPTVKVLCTALDQFLVKPGHRWQLMAGYPWLGMNSRLAIHCVDGLLAAGRDEVAHDIILSSAQTEKDGFLCDWICAGANERTNIEASLRIFEAAKNYVLHSCDMPFWDRAVDADRSLRQVLVDIYESLKSKTANQLSLDEETSMLYCPAGLTWMNTTYPQATPRVGYPVEIQCAWYRALGVLSEIYEPYRREAIEHRENIERHFKALYWDATRCYLYDVLVPGRTMRASQAVADPALRFNQLEAITTGLLPREQGRQIVELITQRLLVPAAIRTLSEDALSVPLVITDDNGRMLVDPRMPYQGHCTGDELQRRLAYHNGTAWPSAYACYIEAHAIAGGYSPQVVQEALSFFEPVWSELFMGGLGTMSEMKDGNYPHANRGCYAYALSVSETLRVYLKLKYESKASGKLVNEITQRLK
ncbi:MAG: glycogen debranching enzyme N-terminal domain-containing protein [Phycisphaerae bacterium]|nr:glycogen debranching enzyme N-terminal domain-containing protein [Phycisphaerae bacterium]